MNIPADWLTRRVETAPTSFQFNTSPATALRTRMAWQKLRYQARRGDQLWAFSSPERNRGGPGRYTGYALVREGKILRATLL